MKRSIQKIRNAHGRLSRPLRTRDRTGAAAHAAVQSSVQKSISKWMDRSKGFVSTLPTMAELRDEFADWHSFEPIHLEELSQT